MTLYEFDLWNFHLIFQKISKNDGNGQIWHVRNSQKFLIWSYKNSKLKVGMTVSVVINTEFKKDIPIIIRPISNLFYKFQTL